MSFETLEFIYGVIDPFTNECWDYYAIDYNEQLDEYADIVGPLIANGIPFLVPSTLLEEFHHDRSDWEWPEDNPGYRTLMEERLATAAQALGDRP